MVLFTNGKKKPNKEILIQNTSTALKSAKSYMKTVNPLNSNTTIYQYDSLTNVKEQSVPIFAPAISPKVTVVKN